MDSISKGEPPRRGSFQGSDASISDSPLTKVTTLGNVAGSINNLRHGQSNVVDSDDDDMITDDDVGFIKSSSTSRRQSVTPMTMIQTQAGFHHSPVSDGDMIEVKQGPYQIPVDPNNKPIGKLKNKYVLPDGTVVNGKGLGRGRPGFKRGPRKSALASEAGDVVISTPAEVSTPSSASQPRSSSGKRKRAMSATDGDYLPETGSKESTPEYNPAASSQTRSGRQTQKPVPIIPVAAATASPASKRPSLGPSTSSPSVKKHPKIKAKVYRGREQFALCEHCLRGNGPPGNVIVFCDACNKCWHQRCHEPRISKEVVADTKAEWFCADCDKILHGKKKAKPGPKPMTAQVLPPPTAPIEFPTQPIEQPVPRYGLPHIPGMSLSPIQRKQYLESLTKEKLINIVLRAADLAPNMPIFETPYHLLRQPQTFQPPAQPHPPTYSMVPYVPNPQLPPSPQPHMQNTGIAQPTVRPPISSSNNTVPIYNHPTAGIPSKPNTQPLPPPTGEDEGYYDDFDEMALLYPKPGEGVYDLALPPENTDLAIMLEGPDCRTFSHWVRGRDETKRVVEGAR